MPTRRLSLPATLLAVVAMLVGLVVSAPRAEATSTILCKGFAACKSAGYKNFGYASNYTKSWWRMYSGHNCTNYVSYRMIRNGMSSTRPWSGSGDARNWGNVFASKTNQTPRVGSVAWWSTNHVAYVQQVVDADTIVISEDHWGGDFDWRRIVRSGGGWPTGFIHLTDESVRPTTVPAITGTPKVDTPLSVTPGTWTPSGASLRYQWRANGRAISGATASSYTPSASQLAQTLTVRVFASKYGYRTGSSITASSAAVAPGTMQNTARPTVTGLVKVGGVLTVHGGSWSPAPTSTTIQWYADGAPIAGATHTTVKLAPAQLGKRITVVLTAKRAGYLDATASSEPTVPVAPEKLTVTREPRVAATSAHVGHAVTVTPGVISPTGVATAYRWLRDGVPIRGATSETYTPTLDDLGTQLSVRVSYTKPGYTSIVRTLTVPGLVKVYPKIRAVSLAHRSVTVVLKADGVATVRGTVTLVNANGVGRTRTLDHGRVTFSPEAWLYSGTRTFTITYQGSRRVDARTVTRTIVVQ